MSESKAKSLNKLSQKEFYTLKKTGILQSIYPDAPEKYEMIFESAKPRPVGNPDFSEVKSKCMQYLEEEVDEGKSVDSNTKHYIFEAAMEAVYGKKVWDFINSKT